MREDTGFSQAEEPGVSAGWPSPPISVLLQDTGDTRPRTLETYPDDDPFAFDSDEGLASW